MAKSKAAKAAKLAKPVETVEAAKPPKTPGRKVLPLDVVANLIHDIKIG